MKGKKGGREEEGGTEGGKEENLEQKNGPGNPALGRQK